MSQIYQNRSGKKVYNWSVLAQIGSIKGRFTLGTKSKQQARKLKVQIDNLELQSRVNPDKAEEYQRVFFDVIGQSNKWLEMKLAADPYFFDVFKECIDNKVSMGVITERTVETYMDTLTNLKQVFKKSFKLSQFNQQQYDKFANYLNEYGYATASRNMKLRCLRSMISWCVGRYINNINIQFNIKNPKETIPRFLYPNEFDKVMQQLPSTSVMGYYFRIYRGTGLRRSEVFTTELLDNKQGRYWLLVNGKGGKQRTVELHPDLLDDWYQLKANPVQVKSITTAWYRACKRADVKARLHDLRHTFAFTQIAMGRPNYELQGLMGHSSFKTTERYLKYDKEMFMDLLDDKQKLIGVNQPIYT